MALATFIGVGTATFVLACATIALVAATGFLGLFTRRLVQEARAARAEARKTREEMEHARLLGVRPRLAFDVMVLGGKVGLLLIRNIGGGPALDVDLTLEFEGAVAETRSWGEPSIVPGESHEIKLPSPFLQDIAAAKDQPLTVRVTGRLSDLETREIAVDERLDFSAWWSGAAGADERVGGRWKLPGVDPSTYGVRQPARAA
ncbi:MAG TPA: hypothetical protein VIM05_02580 [Gaiellaceae bacterium]